jgi:poly(A)-specific ribonuclease
MEITNSRFSSELVNIIQLIAGSHFVAFDLEFSGIAPRRKRGSTSNKLDFQELYDDTKSAAEKYQVLQVGLTIVEENTQQGMNAAWLFGACSGFFS